MTAARWRSVFGWAALGLWIGILFATLFPFRFHPHNDVNWVDGGGLRFGHHGVVISDGPAMPPNAGDDSVCSVELWMQPAAYNGWNTFLGFFSEGLPQFRLRQYRDGIIIRRELGPPGWHYKFLKRDAIHVFSPGQSILLTLTSGPKGTSVYTNGKLLERFPGFTLSRKSMSGVMVLGTDPLHIDAWPGEIRGLALYTQELSATQAAENYRAWPAGLENGKQSSGGAEEGRVALYTFREGQGNEIRNLSAGGAALRILPYFDLPAKPFLAAPWKEFAANADYFNDVVRNILGFVPFGFALCGYLWLGGRAGHAILLTIVLGGLTSLGIEILQGFIPQRESGFTDVITNTLGTAMGAYLARWICALHYIGAAHKTTVIPAETLK